MKDLLQTLVQAVVENPAAVEIEEHEDENGRVTLTINCDQSDRGLVIGQRGRNINAIRTIVKIKAIKEKKFVDIRLKDEVDGPRGDADAEITGDELE